MSHTVTIQAELKDPAALEAACRRLNLPLPTRGKVQLFDRIVEGTGIQLDAWRSYIYLTPQSRFSSTTSAASGACPKDSTN